MSENLPPSVHNQDAHEQYPPFALVAYFQSQFADGYDKQHSEGVSGHNTDNGEFVRTLAVEDSIDGHYLTRGADRIILKPPHPVDSQGDYCEIFAVNLDGKYSSDGMGSYAETFVLCDFEKGKPGPFWLVGLDGVVGLDMDFDIESITNPEDSTGDSDLTTPVERAESMLKKYSTYNIVASTD